MHCVHGYVHSVIVNKLCDVRVYLERLHEAKFISFVES